MKRFAVFLLVLPILAGASSSPEPEIWTCAPDQGSTRDFLLWPGGGAVIVDGGPTADARGRRGFWHARDDSRVVLLESGESAVIRIRRDGATLIDSAGGQPLEKNSALQQPAVRITGPDARWLGVWIWKNPTDSGSRYVSLRSDGAALATPATPGRWVRVPKGIRVEWLDGAIDLLQFDASGPILRSWSPGVPTASLRPPPSRPERAGSSELHVSP